MLSPRRAPNLGKIRRRPKFRLIPLLGPDDALLSPCMISHPLAYVAPKPRHLAPTVGLGAPSSGDMFWTGTLFLPGEHSQPGTPIGVETGMLHGAEAACAASGLVDLLCGIHIHDESSTAAEPVAPESCLVELLNKLHIINERASDVESVGSSDPPVDISSTWTRSPSIPSPSMW